MKDFKIKFILVSATILFLTLLFAPLNKVSAATLFEDNFESQSLSNWQIITGSWIFGADGQNNHWLANNSFNNDNEIQTGDYNWTNYEFSLDIIQKQGADKNIFFRAQNVRSTGLPNHSLPVGYGIHISGNLVELQKWTSNLGQLLSSTSISNTPTHIKIVALGSNIKIYVNSSITTSIDYIDSNSPILNGRIALAVIPGSPSEVWFDNVLVTDLETPTPAPTATPVPTIGPFDLPFDYIGRGTGNDSANFKTTFWTRLNAAFDHTIKEGIFRPFTGNTYFLSDCPAGIYGITCYDSHNGIDFSITGGNLVYPVETGVVAYASTHTNTTCKSSSSGFGCVVIIQHPQNLFTLYAHLSKINVNTNDNVVLNTNIGVMGSTGCSSCGEHLHLGTLIPVPPNPANITKLKKSDWEALLLKIKPDNSTPKFKPFCKYLAPNGQAFSFIDPTGWKGTDTDPWSLSTKNDGCGVPTQYLWKYEVGITP